MAITVTHKLSGASVTFPDDTPPEKIMQAMRSLEADRTGQFAAPQLANATPKTAAEVAAERQVAQDRANPMRKMPVPIPGLYGLVNVGDVTDTLRSVANAAPLIGSFSDEIEAGLQGGLYKITGGLVGQPYDEALAYNRAYDKAVQDENPVANITGTLVGGASAPLARGATVAKDIGLTAAQAFGYGAAHGLGASEGDLTDRAVNAATTGGVSAAVAGPLAGVLHGGQAIGRAYANMGQAGAYGKIADDLPGGVDEFANQIATGGSRANVTTNRRTLDILGEEMERAGGDVQRAQQATIARIAAEAGVTPQTAAAQIRRLTNVHADSDLMLGEYPAVSVSDTAQRMRQPGNVDLDELGRVQNSTTQAKIDYLANNGSAQSAQNVRDAIEQRQEQLAPSMRETLEGFAPRAGNRPATIEDTANLVDTATRTAQAEYRQAYSAPVATPQSLQELPRVLNRYMTRAATRSPDVANTIRNAVNQFVVRDQQGNIRIQSLRQLQDARTTLRGQMAALERSGREDLSRLLRPLYQYVTRTMEDMSPAWGQANRRWAGMRFAEQAQELGDAFATKAGPRFREQLEEFRRMAPEAQNIVRVHFLQQLFDKLDNLGDSHSVSKLFATDQARRMIREMFGNEAAVTFTRAIRDQKVAEASSRMLGNSRTHMRGQAQKQMDAETGLVAAAEQANARGVRNWLLERMTQVLTERRNRPMAEVLTTPLSDTAQVARHLYRMRQQQQRLRQMSRPRDRNRIVPVGAGLAASSQVED